VEEVLQSLLGFLLLGCDQGYLAQNMDYLERRRSNRGEDPRRSLDRSGHEINTAGEKTAAMENSGFSVGARS
jgi:hypothetical protein